MDQGELGLIFVTGVPRSGTSLTVKILRALGAVTGEVNVLYENTHVRENVLKPLIAANGGDPLGQKSFPDLDTVEAIGLAQKLANYIGVTMGPKTLYKDPKITLVWPAFAEAFPDAKWIVVRREMESQIDALIRVPFITVHGEDREAWRRWIMEYEWRLDRLVAETGAIEVRPADFIGDPAAFEPAARHAGLPFDASAVANAVDPSKYRA
jgi:hypothetical protein